jgi:hypothetical protein
MKLKHISLVGLVRRTKKRAKKRKKNSKRRGRKERPSENVFAAEAECDDDDDDDDMEDDDDDDDDEMDDDDGEGDEAGTGLFDLLENNVTLSAYRKRIEAMERERERTEQKNSETATTATAATCLDDSLAHDHPYTRKEKTQEDSAAAAAAAADDHKELHLRPLGERKKNPFPLLRPTSCTLCAFREMLKKSITHCNALWPF